MVGQEVHGWWGHAEDTLATWEMTVQVKNRDTFAEVALTGFYDDGDLPGGYIGIVQIVSDSGVETFVPGGVWSISEYAQARFRTNMTSVTVQIAAWDSFVRGRLFLNFWS